MTAQEQASPRGSRVKRWIALAGLVAIAASIVVAIGIGAVTVQQAGDGADPDEAFSPTENIPGALTADVVWEPDAANLVRLVEPSTREAVAVMWLRADDALERAAGGETSGLDVWFVDGALGAAQGRFADDAAAVEVAPAIGHRLRVDFYSLDGQVIVLSADTIRLRPESTVERLEALLVLSDGNWRIRHLERLTPDAQSAEDIVGS